MKINGIVILILSVCLMVLSKAFIWEDKTSVDHVGLMLGQLVQHHFNDCHLVLITSNPQSPIFSAILSFVQRSTVLLDMSQPEDKEVHSALSGDTYLTCRAIILHHNDPSNNTEQTLNMLEGAGLWKMPDTRVVVVSVRTTAKNILLHPCFRNSIKAICIIFNENQVLQSSLKVKLNNVTSELKQMVSVYHRCLYCKNGNPGVKHIPYITMDSLTWQKESFLFPDQLRNMFGHIFNVVTVSYFPYIDYYKDYDKPGSTVTLRDSIDTRLIRIISAKLNFTTVIREEPERSWGLEANGQFSGMMGQLQREEVDFCTEAAPTPGRLRVVDYARGYPSDEMSLTSLKPNLLPQITALVRPFLAEVWVAVAFGVVGWSVTTWVLQRIWRFATARQDVPFPTVLIYGWGALLDQPPEDPSVTLSGKMLVGWWLVFCLVISTAFRSSLIAHLTVQSTTKPIETLKDLVSQKNWKWGTEEKLYKGAVIEYFSRHSDPVVQEIHSKLEILDSEEALDKVKKGSYTLICFNDYISVIVNSRFTDAQGRSPYYISKKGFSVFANLGWAFRKGAPFFSRFSLLLNRLEDAGLTSYWTNDVVRRRIRENRAIADVEKTQRQVTTVQENVKQVVLGLGHVQGAFYLLFLGFGGALLCLMFENILQVSKKGGGQEVSVRSF